MSVVRVIYLGTPDFAVTPLRAMANDEHFEIVRVYTQPDKPAGRSMKIQPTPVKAAALELGLDVKNVENINAQEILSEIKELKVEAAVVVAFGQILSADFLSIFPHGAVNIHSSLLPRWRGAAPMQRALMAGDQETGVALQKVVQQLDAGDILGVRKVALTDDIEINGLYTILKQKSCELLEIEFMDYLRGNLTGAAQDPKGVTVAKKIKKEEGLIDWSKSSREILNQWRGLNSWPGVWTFREGQMLKLKFVRATSMRHTSKPGTVIAVAKDSFTVNCGSGALEVLELQPESRSKMTAGEYMRGHPLKIGEKLG